MSNIRVAVAYAEEDRAAAEAVLTGLDRGGVKAEAAPLALGFAPEPGSRLLVLWSRHAENARGAVRRGLLAGADVVVARLDAARPPARPGLNFLSLQRWRGRGDHRGWQAVRTALGAGPGPGQARFALAPIAAPAGRSGPSVAAPAPQPSVGPAHKPRGNLLGVGLAVAALVCVFAVAAAVLFG
jgi:hypothetical protein